MNQLITGHCYEHTHFPVCGSIPGPHNSNHAHPSCLLIPTKTPTRTSKDHRKKCGASTYIHLDRIFKDQTKRSSINMYTHLDPARPIRITSLTSASRKPSHQLNVFVVLILTHTAYLPTAPIRLKFDPSLPINVTDYVFTPSPTTILCRSGGIGIGIDEDEQRKSQAPKAYPVGRSMTRPKGSEALVNGQ